MHAQESNIINERITKINQILYILEENGVDLKNEHERLDEIMLKYSMKTFESMKDDYEKDLLQFLVSLDKYSNIMSLINRLASLESTYNLNIIVNETKIIIETIKENKNFPKKLIEKSIQIIYKNIKVEIEKNLKSDIIDLIKYDTFFTNYISEYIKKEIEYLKSSAFINNGEMLSLLKQEEERCKNNNNYLDENLIIILLSCTQKEDLRRHAQHVIEDNYTTFCENNRFTSDFLLSKNVSNLKQTIEGYKKLKKSLGLRVLSLTFTSSLIGVSLIGAPGLAKQISYKNEYKTTTEKYRLESAIYDEDKVTSYERKINDEGKKVILTVHSKLEKINHNHYHRKETVYDITSASVEKENFYYYIHANLDQDNIKEISSTTTCYNNDDYYKDEIRELTITTQDFNDEKEVFDESNYKKALVVFYIVLTLGTLSPGFPVNNAFKIFKTLKQIKENKARIYSQNAFIKDYFDCVHIKLNENKEINKRYLFLLKSGILDHSVEDLERMIEDLNDLNYETQEKENEFKELIKILK